jgi:hypothetical protein
MEMRLFHILTETNQRMDLEVVPMLINLNHLVSIKPIRIMANEELIDGYWVRISNGKKYRAIQIPAELKEQLEDHSSLKPHLQ